MNIWDAVILAAVAAGVVLAARQVRKNRRNGKCPGGCDGCGNAPCCRTAGDKPGDAA